MRPEEAYDCINRQLPYEPGAFYGSTAGLSIGAGMLYSNVRQPLFDHESRLFKTVKALAYVVTHECDADQNNNRAFIDSVLVCPIIHFDVFVGLCAGMPNLSGFLAEIANRRVFRLLYMPVADGLPYGGILYLNRITSTHVSVFLEDRTECVAAVAGIGLREIDAALQNLLLREKAQLLTGMRRT